VAGQTVLVRFIPCGDLVEVSVRELAQLVGRDLMARMSVEPDEDGAIPVFKGNERGMCPICDANTAQQTDRQTAVAGL